MTKYLFFDIDGTLVGASRQITELNKKALEQLKEKGHKVFLCTGRAPSCITEDLTSLPIEGMVCSAGGFVKIHDEFIFENMINQYILSEVMTLFINNKILFTLETKEALYQTPGVNEFFKKFHLEWTQDNVELIRFLEMRMEQQNRRPIQEFDILTVGVPKVCFIAPDKSRFERCIKFLEEFFHIVIFSKDEDDYVNGEIVLKGCTKADGIDKVLRYYGASIEDAIGFGDSMNDYQMLERVHTSVVYEQASEELLALADRTFIEPDLDGIYQCLVQMNLIEEIENEDSINRS